MALLLLLPLSASAEYLGELSANPYAPDSTANPYGAGSPFKPDGINNPYSPFGSPFSNQSATNPYATDAPCVRGAPLRLKGPCLLPNAYPIVMAENR